MQFELTEAYLPDKLLFRDDQISEIEEVFKRFKLHEQPKNLLIHGFSGSGKTTCINDVLSRQNGNYVYISGTQCITAHQILRGITDLNYNTREKILSKAINNMKRKPQVIVIDELNKMKRVEEIKWLFNDLNTLYRETNKSCPIIVITNRTSYETGRSIPDDAKKTLFLNRVEFKPYNAVELGGILQQRIDKTAIIIPEGFIPLLSTKVFKDYDGSVRSGLFILNECIEANDFSVEMIDKLLEKIKGEEFEEIFQAFPEHEKKFLASLIVLSDEKNEPIPISWIIQNFKELLPQRISQIINSLESYGILIRISPSKDKRKKFVKFIRDDIFQRVNELTSEMIPFVSSTR